MCGGRETKVGFWFKRECHPMIVSKLPSFIRFILFLQSIVSSSQISSIDNHDSTSLLKVPLSIRRLEAAQSFTPQQSTQSQTFPPTQPPSITAAPFLPVIQTPHGTLPSNNVIFIPTKLVKPSSPQLLSDSPSQMPSQISSSPSASLQMVRSDYPSISPSYHPSSLNATQAETSSDYPSLSPSQTPSGVFSTISDHPSFSPSLIPSSLSSSISKFSSDYPSLLPSHSPSAPSVYHSLAASDFPSTNPSDSPSINPSITPTVSPSALPSFAPSSQPSTGLSSIPSKSPSSHPSTIATLSPTPRAPSLSPSSSPSVAPTQICHDNPSYVSPINNLTCGAFQKTDCTQWRFIGLTVDELQVLIDSCPKACNVTCGDFTQFRVRIAYHIANMPGLMSSGSVDALQQISQGFLTSYVQANIPPSDDFAVLGVVLSSQAILTSGVNRRDLWSRNSHWKRSLQSTSDVTLDVSMIFSGFAIHLTTETITDQLVSGLDDPEYTKSIQQSGDPYLTAAVASSAIKTGQPTTPAKINERQGGPSTSTVAALTVVAFLSIAVIGSGAYLYRRRSGHWIPTRLRRDPPKPLNRFGSCSPRSLEEGSFPHADLASLSFSSNQSGRGLVRLVLSNSRDSTSPSSGSNQSPDEGLEEGTIPLAITEKIEERVEEPEKEEHPLDGIIPPMVVFDNIDDQEERHDLGHTTRNKEGLGVPVRHIVASTGLLAALNDNDKPLTPTSLAKMMYKEAPGLYRPSTEVTRLQLEAIDSPTSTEMYSSENSDVLTEIPSLSKSSTREEVAPMRRSKSSNAFDELVAVTEAVEVSRSYRRATSDMGPAMLRDINCHSLLCQDDQQAGTSQKPSDLVPLLQNETPLKRQKGYLSDTSADTSLAEARTVRRGNERVGRRSFPSSAAEGMLRHSLWARKPMRKPVSEPPPMTSDVKNSIPQTNVEGSFRRKDSKEGFEFMVDPADWPSSPSLSGSGSFDSLDEFVSSRAQEVGPRYEVSAPRNKKLGLVIESTQNEGPIIHEVKEQSPLYGLVQPGDKIIIVDGTDTSQMSLFAVTSLLGEKRQRRDGDLMRITLVRPSEQDDQQNHPLRMKNNEESDKSFSEESLFLDYDNEGNGSASSFDLADSLEERQPSSPPLDRAVLYPFLPLGGDLTMSRSSIDWMDYIEEEEPTPPDTITENPPYTFPVADPGLGRYGSRTSLEPTQRLRSSDAPAQVLPFFSPTGYLAPAVEPSQAETLFDPTQSLESQLDAISNEPLAAVLENESMISYGTTESSEVPQPQQHYDAVEENIFRHPFAKIHRAESMVSDDSSDGFDETQLNQNIGRLDDLRPNQSLGVDHTESMISYDTPRVSEEGLPSQRSETP